MSTQHHNVDLHVRINGNNVATFAHEGKTFVEGREGTEWSLFVRNNNLHRVKAILSVDQVNVISGKPSTGEQEETGYILDPGESQTILGYRLDDDSVARFKFAKAEGSYASTEVGLKGTTGVIGCRVYREKAAPMTVVHHHHDYWRDWWPYYSRPYWWGNGGTITTCGNITLANSNTVTSLNLNATNTCAGTAAFTASNSAGSSQMRAMSLNTCSAGASAPVAQSSMQCSVADNAPVEDNPFTLGSTFGAKAESKVTSVAFVADFLLGEVSVYYSTRAGLVALGVDVTRKPKVAFPNPFSGVYCKVPKGWVG